MTSVPTDQTVPTDPIGPSDEVDDLPEQLRVRRDKRDRLIASGHAAYPVWVDRTHSLGDLRRDWGHLEAGQETEAVVRTAGRVMYIRNTGKLCFATLQEGAGTRLQVMLSLAEVDAGETRRSVPRRHTGSRPVPDKPPHRGRR